MNWILILFLITQLFGLFVISVNPVQTVDSSGLVYIPLGILLGTVFMFILIKFNLKKTWKLWFSMASLIGITLTLEVFIGWFSLPVSMILVYFKIFKPNNYVHNISEILIYPGIILMILPFVTVPVVIILMLLLSFYDMYSVWKSKHMITLAKFQREVAFAGLKIKKRKEERILGGGDVAFPLLFSSALFLEIGNLALFSVVGSFLGLSLLFFISKKGKYYPALPFLTLGLFLGYGLSLLF